MNLSCFVSIQRGRENRRKIPVRREEYISSFADYSLSLAIALSRSVIVVLAVMFSPTMFNSHLHLLVSLRHLYNHIPNVQQRENSCTARGTVWLQCNCCNAWLVDVGWCHVVLLRFPSRFKDNCLRRRNSRELKQKEGSFPICFQNLISLSSPCLPLELWLCLWSFVGSFSMGWSRSTPMRRGVSKTLKASLELLVRFTTLSVVTLTMMDMMISRGKLGSLVCL